MNKKEIYLVWSVLEEDSVKFYVVNTRFGVIHSSWSNLIEARKTAKDLNQTLNMILQNNESTEKVKDVDDKSGS